MLWIETGLAADEGWQQSSGIESCFADRIMQWGLQLT